MNYPSTWESVTIGESLDLINGRAFKPTEWSAAGRPIIRIQNLNNPKAGFNYYAGPLPEKFSVTTGDLLFAWSGTPGTSFGAHVWKGPDAWLNQHIFKVVFPEKVFAKTFLQLAINQNLSQYIGVAHGGAGLAHITKGKFESSSIPLPPLPEQKRIVAKIEELFSELEAGEASLRKARRQLGVYRQSLLKQAFEGKLTAKWRTQNPDKLESPASLLASASDSRRERWSGRGKCQAAKGPKLDAERPIPDCWCYASVDQITLNFDGQRVPLKREHRDKRSGAYPYYGASGIIDDIDDYLFEGDYLLIAEDGANLLSRSTPIAFQAHGKFWVNNHAHIVQPVSAVLMRFLEFYLNGRDLTRFISGTAQPKLNQANLDQIPVPLCSLPEQQEIVRLLDEQFEAIERNERELDAALNRSEALRQSILKRAFSGRLVPQDPADEPASTLLARLRAERDQAGKGGRTRR